MEQRRVRFVAMAALAAVGFTAALPAATTLADSAWTELKPMVFGDRPVLDGRDIVRLTTPYRSMDDRKARVAIDAVFANGRSVKTVTLMIDENPMPVAAVFRFGDGRRRAALATNVRLNGPSPVRAVVEASDGRLYMTDSYVKTSGLGACASPPVGDPGQALATLGRMTLADATAGNGPAHASRRRRHVRLAIKHPNITGLQIDQITLQQIPAWYVSEIEIRQGAQKLFAMQGGISLSEDPEISFDYASNGADHLTVRVQDTKGGVYERRLSTAPES